MHESGNKFLQFTSAPAVAMAGVLAVSGNRARRVSRQRVGSPRARANRSVLLFGLLLYASTAMMGEAQYAQGGVFTSWGFADEGPHEPESLYVTDLSSISGTAPAGSHLALKKIAVAPSPGDMRMFFGSDTSSRVLTVDEAEISGTVFEDVNDGGGVGRDLATANADSGAFTIAHAHLIKDLDNGYLAVLVDLIQAVEDSCPKTRGHSRRVAELAGSLAQAMGLAEPRIQLLVRAAALHSVGRLSTRPDGGAKAKGRPQIWEEWSPTAVMATEKVLAPFATRREVREIILHSANPFDTTQSVLGVDRPGIPVESRILAVCEEFVRRTAGNGRNAKVRRQALEAIRKRAGQKHDPDVVAALSHLTKAGEAR